MSLVLLDISGGPASSTCRGFPPNGGSADTDSDD